MIDFTITEFTLDYVPQALELLKQGYQREKKYISFLPDFSSAADKTGELQWFAGEKFGFMALKDGELLGFFCYYPPFKGVYNTVKEFGSWSPLHAHGIKEMDDKQTAAVWSRLVQTAMEKASAEGSVYHSATLFRHETLLQEILHMYGFGNRYADSMLDVEKYGMTIKNQAANKDTITDAGGFRISQTNEEDFTIRQTCKEDFPVLRELRRGLSYHLTKAPCFCLHNENQFEEYIHERETSEGLVTFGLYNPDDKLIGFIDTNEDDGENFVSQGTDILNISGMFLSDDYRGKGLAKLLVDAAVEEARNLGKAVLGVDYETMNPTARGFWEKYFTPYTLSLVRRIDVEPK